MPSDRPEFRDTLIDLAFSEDSTLAAAAISRMPELGDDLVEVLQDLVNGVETVRRTAAIDALGRLDTLDSTMVLANVV